MQNLEFLPSALLLWYARNARALPWREDRDPYRVWISEIMLQQTRVEAVVGYYRRFLSELPDIAALAAVADDRLMKLWQGLGYYSRARNLKKAASAIMEQYGGAFPSSYDDILSLPGIGAYTAGAIGSICFELPTPAVDGNVLRVFARYTAWEEQIDSDGAKEYVSSALRPIYPPGSCGAFTQSLMELGACVCLPNGAPDCPDCPLRDHCRSFAAGTQTDYPRKVGKKSRRAENRIVVVMNCGGRFAIRKRPEKGLLASLWEFPGVPAPEDPSEYEKTALEYAETAGTAPVRVSGIKEYSHIFTHVEWRVTGVFIECAGQPEAFTWASKTELREKYALPTAFRKLLPEK